MLALMRRGSRSRTRGRPAPAQRAVPDCGSRAESPGHRDDGSGADSLGSGTADELYLAVEDEHRVDVIVDVGRDLEGRVELDLVDR